MWLQARQCFRRILIFTTGRPQRAVAVDRLRLTCFLEQMARLFSQSIVKWRLSFPPGELASYYHRALIPLVQGRTLPWNRPDTLRT